jgi:hypothetical protein
MQVKKESSLGSVLPFIRKAGIAFDDRVTEIIGRAFDSACRQAREAEQPATVYEAIAKRIIDAAKNGERDPVRLHDAGLKGLGFDEEGADAS